MGAITASVSTAWFLRGAGRGYAYDESVTIGLFVDAAPWAPFTRQQEANNHPFFSLLEQLVWRLGGTSETWMRALPALFAGATVGLLVWWCTKRWNLASGFVAGVVLATSPMFVYFGQHTRGYSLMVLCGVASTMIAVSILDGDEQRNVEVGYVVVGAIGVATHLYMVFVLASHVGLVVAHGSLRDRWPRRWLRLSALGLCAYAVGAFPAGRPGEFLERLPFEVAWEVLGASLVSVVVFGSALAVALRQAPRSFAMVVPPLGLFVLVWAIVRPLYLYPRFFVFVVPAVAVGVAFAVQHARLLALPVLVASVFVAPLSSPDDFGLRATAEVLEASAARGDLVCAVGSEALVAYITPVPEFGEETRCDVIARIGSWEPPGLDQATAGLVPSRIGNITVLGADRADIERVEGDWGASS